MFRKNKKPVYRFIFLRLQNSVYRVERIIKRAKINKLITIDNKKFAVLIDHPSFVEGNNLSYLIDYDSGQQLIFHKIDSKIAPEDLDLIVGQRIIRDLTRGVLDNGKTMLMYALIGAAIGGLAVGVILLAYFNSKIEGIYNSFNTAGNTVIPVLNSVKLYFQKRIRWFK